MLKIEAPSISAADGSSDDESSSGDDEMPLTREQLKTQVRGLLMSHPYSG